MVNLLSNFRPDDTIGPTGTPKEMTSKASWEAFVINTIRPTGITKASWEAFIIQTIFGVPPGSIDMTTVIPELIAVIKIQVNLVYKIAKYYEKERQVTSPIIIHILATALEMVLGRNIMKKTGTRIIMRPVGSKAITNLARKLGTRMTLEFVARIGDRRIPFVTATMLGAYFRGQTKKVGNAAIDVFSKDIEFEKMTACSQGHEIPGGGRFCPEYGETIGK